METIRIERTFFCGAEPHVIINTRRRITIWLNRNGFHPTLVSPCLNKSHVTQFASMNKVHRILVMFVAVLPLTYLHHAVVFFLRGHHSSTFHNGIANRLFAV